MIGIRDTDHFRGRNACLKSIRLRRDIGPVVFDESCRFIGVITIKGPEAMRIRIDGEPGRIDMSVFLSPPVERKTNRWNRRRIGRTRWLQRNGLLYPI